MTARFISCMGGWCQLRDRCQFHLSSGSPFVSERRCLPGEDGLYMREGEYVRVQLVPIVSGVKPKPEPEPIAQHDWYSPIWAPAQPEAA